MIDIINSDYLLNTVKLRKIIYICCYSILSYFVYIYLLKPFYLNIIRVVYYSNRLFSCPSHPIYGHLLELVPEFPNPNYEIKNSTRNFLQLISKSIEASKNRGPSVIWFSWIPFVVVSGPEAVETIYNKSNLMKPSFYKLIGLKEGLVTSDPNKWKVRRKIIEPFFTSKRLRQLVYSMDDEIGKMTDQMVDKTNVKVDIEHLICKSAFNIILEATLGIARDRFDKERELILDFISKGETYFMQRVYNPLFWYDRLYRMFKAGQMYQQNLDEAYSIVDVYIQQSRRTRTEVRQALIDIFFSLKDKAIDNEGIQEECVTMASAGHETTSVGLRWMLFNLGNNFDIQERLYQEVVGVFPDKSPVDDIDKIFQCTYLDKCVKESLRLHPPIAGFSRKLTQDVHLRGKFIPKNTSVTLSIFNTHRDPTIYPEPEKYDPERWTPEFFENIPKGAFVPFGFGPRNCIGYRYALIELKIYLIHIVRRFRFKSILKPWQVDYRFEITLKPNCPLEMIYTLRDHIDS